MISISNLVIICLRNNDHFAIYIRLIGHSVEAGLQIAVSILSFITMLTNLMIINIKDHLC